MRRCLDRLYHLALWLAALCLVAIALLVGVQIAGRLVDGALQLAGLQPYGFVILSLAEIAGYLLAAASFLALAATLKSGVHIRVTIVLAALGERRRRFLELWALGAATVLGAYMTFNIARFAFFSWQIPRGLPWPHSSSTRHPAGRDGGGCSCPHHRTSGRTRHRRTWRYGRHSRHRRCADTGQGGMIGPPAGVHPDASVVRAARIRHLDRAGAGGMRACGPC